MGELLEKNNGSKPFLQKRTHVSVGLSMYKRKQKITAKGNCYALVFNNKSKNMSNDFIYCHP